MPKSIKRLRSANKGLSDNRRSGDMLDSGQPKPHFLYVPDDQLLSWYIAYRLDDPKYDPTADLKSFVKLTSKPKRKRKAAVRRKRR